MLRAQMLSGVVPSPTYFLPGGDKAGDQERPRREWQSLCVRARCLWGGAGACLLPRSCLSVLVIQSLCCRLFCSCHLKSVPALGTPALSLTVMLTPKCLSTSLILSSSMARGLVEAET